MGVPPSEWEFLDEEQRVGLLATHQHVRDLESKKWDERIRVILKGLGAVK